MGREPGEFEEFIEMFWRLVRHPHRDDPEDVVAELMALYGHIIDEDDDVYGHINDYLMYN